MSELSQKNRKFLFREKERNNNIIGPGRTSMK